ncbi:DUF1045 domain-containing protein [Devosia sp.]|uniref:DUF1045 domain-containing protein n=1 Tax=Devosia sp. TaxID=1871048 RepID=UPI003A8F3E9E
MTERFAIYYAPAVDDPLWQHANSWLGRDPSNAGPVGTVDGISRERLDSLTESARRYGFHATLRAPMRLSDGQSREDLEAALAAFAARRKPEAIGMLEVASLDGFIALVPQPQQVPLTVLAADLVESLEPFRAPMSVEDKIRRTAGGRLTARQLELLERFGYPYVLEQFQFHMTLTDRLVPEDEPEMIQLARHVFSGEMGTPRMLDRIALYHEAEPGAPFMRVADFELTGTPT